MGNIYIYRFLIENTQNKKNIFDYDLNYYVLNTRLKQITNGKISHVI